VSTSHEISPGSNRYYHPKDIILVMSRGKDENTSPGQANRLRKIHVFVVFTDKNIEGLFILHKTVRVKPRPCLTSSRTSAERYPVSEKWYTGAGPYDTNWKN